MRTVNIESFPGLDLRADPGNSQGAIDMMNVALGRGGVRSRDGSAAVFVLPAGAPLFLDTFFRSISQPVLILGTTATGVNNRFVVNELGTVIASFNEATAMTDRGASGVSIGTPANSFYFLVHDGAALRYDGTSIIAAAGLPATPQLVSISQADNRLMVIDQNSKVSFSDPGAPQTFGANNFVSLMPGDGEQATGVAVYGNQTFVFKSSRVFIFYGNSTDTTGNPVFNYRVQTLSGRARAGLIQPQQFCTGPDGVYYIAQDGIYRTSGGPATKVSAPLDPLFDGTFGPFWAGGGITSSIGAASPQRIRWVDDKMYVSLLYDAGAGLQDNHTFVYDRETDAWSMWNVSAGSFAEMPASSTSTDRRVLVFGELNTLRLSRVLPGLTADSGVPFVSRYRLPFEDYGSSGRKHIRETLLSGSGTPTVQWSKDWGALPTGSAVPLGAAPGLAESRQRLGVLGKTFSLQMGAASGAWSVNRVQVNIHDAISGPEADA